MSDQSREETTAIALAVMNKTLERVEKKLDEMNLSVNLLRDWRIEHQQQAESRDRHISFQGQEISQLKCDREKDLADLRVVLFFSRNPKFTAPFITGLILLFLFSVWGPLRSILSSLA